MKKSELKKEIRNSVLEKKAKTDEMSTSGAAGGYDTPYAFRRPGAKPNDEEMLKLGYKPVDEDLSAYKKTPMKMGDLETNDDGVKKPIYLNYGYKIVDKSKS